MDLNSLGVFGIIIACLFTSNIVFTNFLGICPFLGISKKPSNAIGMGLALVFVVTMSSVLCYAIEKFILQPLGLDYLQLLIFILVIASFVQFVEFFMKKYMKGLYNSLGIYLPLITTNCIVLYAAQFVANYTINNEVVLFYNFGKVLIYSIFIALGYMMVITLFSFIRIRVDENAVPTPFKGNAIALITTALMALAFLAFSGIM